MGSNPTGGAMQTLTERGQLSLYHGKLKHYVGEPGKTFQLSQTEIIHAQSKWNWEGLGDHCFWPQDPSLDPVLCWIEETTIYEDAT